MCYAALSENQMTVFIQAIKGKEEVKSHNRLLGVGKQHYMEGMLPTAVLRKQGLHGLQIRTDTLRVI